MKFSDSKSVTTNWKSTNLVELEKHIINYWRTNKIPEKTINSTIDKHEIVFVDGPPFCTGNMHFGHVLVSTVKDILARYYTMKGFRVDRRNGWDTHGVPIEQLAKNTIGYKNRSELLEFGIDRHNDICRKLVMKCADIWHEDFERLGRWVDRKNEYKTMDLKFMESVFWVFKQLYQKSSIYEGYKVLPYSIGCNTVLSHFEAKQNYKTITESSIYVQFKLKNMEKFIDKFNIKSDTDIDFYVVVWTTTPWSLPTNLAICTNPDIKMVCLYDIRDSRYIIVSECKFNTSYSRIMHKDLPRFNVMVEMKGSELEGIQYEPCYHYIKYDEKSIAWRIVLDPYVKLDPDSRGTGFVHLSPMHGEDDFRVCLKYNIIDTKNTNGYLIEDIDADGCFTNLITEYSKLYIKNADKLIISSLRDRGILMGVEPYTHSYPFCYRTDTPLIYKIDKAWFVKASDPEFRTQMIINSKINWQPSSVGTNHFENWLENSVDWCVSRSRYWGTPIPIWRSDDNEETICIGSISELSMLSNIDIDKIHDLHIDFVDKITIKSKSGRILKRVTGVLDCWFESGCVPYGQIHYPFENSNIFSDKRHHIADFITESKDQTRGWFYTLNVLSTALFNKPAYQNVIVTGIINGTDGHKMSKSKGNYTEPKLVIDKYGADTTRLYLISTPVVKAETIKFDESQIAKLQQISIVKIYNIALFLVEKIDLHNRYHPDKRVNYPSHEVLDTLSDVVDRWIIDKTAWLAFELDRDFKSYKIAFIATKILSYIDQLTNWYLKLARERLKGQTSRSTDALYTLLFVVYQFIKIIAPVMPFISETVYLMIQNYLPDRLDSVHLLKYPEQTEFIIEPGLDQKFDIIQSIITGVREIRDTIKFYHRKPLHSISIGHIYDNHSTVIELQEYIKTECNVLNIEKVDFHDLIKMMIYPNMSYLSSHLKSMKDRSETMSNDIKHLRTFIENLSVNDVQDILEINRKIIEPITKIIITTDMIDVKYILKEKNPCCRVVKNMVIKVDNRDTIETNREYLLRLIKSSVQKHRKIYEMKPWDTIDIILDTDKELIEFIKINFTKLITKNVRKFELCNPDDELAKFIKDNFHNILSRSICEITIPDVIKHIWDERTKLSEHNILHHKLRIVSKNID